VGQKVVEEEDNAPAVPDALVLLALGDILLEGIDLVADFEGDDVPVYERLDS